MDGCYRTQTQKIGDPPPLAKLLTRKSKLLLINLILSMNLSSISYMRLLPSLSMYLSTSTFIQIFTDLY